MLLDIAFISQVDQCKTDARLVPTRRVFCLLRLRSSVQHESIVLFPNLLLGPLVTHAVEDGARFLFVPVPETAAVFQRPFLHESLLDGFKTWTTIRLAQAESLQPASDISCANAVDLAERCQVDVGFRLHRGAPFFAWADLLKSDWSLAVMISLMRTTSS